MERLGFSLYLFFIVSWFLRLTARIPALGVVRLDLVLVVLIFAIYLFSVDKRKIKGLDNPVYKRMLLLIFVILAITPFAEWPGSVIRFGLPNYLKAIVFFFFTVWYVQKETRLKLLIMVFLLCQSFRVLEPLYLHVTQGYWGSKASMAGWQFMDRLSGAPYDVINPNGLAFVILTILSFSLYLYRENPFWKLFALTIIPASLYALYLTGSRSGMLGLGVILVIVVVQSKRKVAVMITIVALGLLAFVNMEGNFKDRYVSIFSADTANNATAQGRIDGIWSDFRVGFGNPILGHGLGTSAEANANFRGIAQISHNLYAETFQEIGLVGLSVFISLIYLIFQNLSHTVTDVAFVKNLKSGVLICVSMNLFFGLASYGLSSYEWYFLAALSLIIFENRREMANEKESAFSNSLASRRNPDLPPVRVSQL